MPGSLFLDLGSLNPFPEIRSSKILLYFIKHSGTCFIWTFYKFVHWKTWENLWLLDVFRSYRNGTLGWNDPILFTTLQHWKNTGKLFVEYWITLKWMRTWVRNGLSSLSTDVLQKVLKSTFSSKCWSPV